VAEAVDMLAQFGYLAGLDRVVGDRPAEVEHRRPDVHPGAGIGGELGEAVVGGHTPGLGALQGGLVTVVPAHRRRPFPQRPGHHRGDIWGEALRGDDHVVASAPGAQRGGQTHYAGTDDQHLRPSTAEVNDIHVS
jgi:hypothetical protein